MVIKRGDIFYADLSTSIGAEISGTRPVVIIQNDIANKYSPTIIVAPITSNTNSVKLPTHIAVSTQETGLSKESIVLLEHVRSIDKQRLKTKIGRINEALQEQIISALKVASGDTLYSDNNQASNENILINSTFNIESQYKDFYLLIENQTESIEKLHEFFKSSNSYKSKLKDWFIGGVIGAILGAIASLLI